MAGNRLNYYVKDLHEAAFIAFQMNEMPRCVKRETRGPLVFEWNDAEEVGVQSRMYLSGAGVSREMPARAFAQKFREIKELLYMKKAELENEPQSKLKIGENSRGKLETICKDKNLKEDDFIAQAVAEKLERTDATSDRT